MKSKLLLILCLTAFAPVLHAALGIGPVSFTDHCLPLLKDRKQDELLSALAAFDIKDAGRGFIPSGPALPPPAKEEDNRTAPFAFLARPKGTKGDYNLLLVIQGGASIVKAITFDIEDVGKWGLVILPRNIAPGDPLLDFSK